MTQSKCVRFGYLVGVAHRQQSIYIHASARWDMGVEAISWQHSPILRSLLSRRLAHSWRKENDVEIQLICFVWTKHEKGGICSTKVWNLAWMTKDPNLSIISTVKSWLCDGAWSSWPWMFCCTIQAIMDGLSIAWYTLQYTVSYRSLSHTAVYTVLYCTTYCTVHL